MMAEWGIRLVSELARRLERIGISISVVQPGRLSDGKAQHWNQKVIEGLMTVFDCELQELLQLAVKQAKPRIIASTYELFLPSFEFDIWKKQLVMLVWIMSAHPPMKGRMYFEHV